MDRQNAPPAKDKCCAASIHNSDVMDDLSASETEEDAQIYAVAQTQAQAARARQLLEEARGSGIAPQPSQETLNARFLLGQPSQSSQGENQMSQLSQAELSQLVLPHPSRPSYTTRAGAPGPSPTQDTILASQESTESRAFAQLEAHLANLPSQSQTQASQPQPTQPARVTASATGATRATNNNGNANGNANVNTASNYSGRSTGSRNYTEEERLHFLEIIERRLPTNGTEWSFVAREHAETYVEYKRDVASIKRQYQSLLRRREPTGDPQCPPDVKKAKYVDRLLKAKQSAGDISEESGGPLAAVAGLEAATTSSERNSEAGSVRPPALQAGQVLVQKRKESPKSSANQSLLESMLAMQVMAQQNAAAERAEQRKREREEREAERREREKDRKAQRQREERREDMFLSLVGIGLAIAGKNSVDPGALMQNIRRPRQDSDNDDEKQGDGQDTGNN